MWKIVCNNMKYFNMRMVHYVENYHEVKYNNVRMSHYMKDWNEMEYFVMMWCYNIHPGRFMETKSSLMAGCHTVIKNWDKISFHIIRSKMQKVKPL